MDVNYYCIPFFWINRFHIWFMRSGDVVRCWSANHLPDAIKRINLMQLNPAAQRLKGPTH